MPKSGAKYSTIDDISTAEAMSRNAIGDSNLNQRVYARAITSGTLRGTHMLGDNKVTIDNENSRILIDSEAGTPIMLIGKLPDGSYGIAIAKPGENVLDSF